MIIQNFDQLARSGLRRDALRILNSGYESVMTEPALKARFRIEDDILRITGAPRRNGENKMFQISLPQFKRIFVVAIGKCAFDAGKALEDILGARITAGIVLDVQGGDLKYLKSEIGTHPFPSKKNVEITRSIIRMLAGLSADDLVIAVISGGGSSLLSLPHSFLPEELAELSKTLMQKGADIRELNTVRKHTSEIQGGNLAKIAYPAKIVSLIFSDVIGNDVGMVASGPTVRDETDISDAKNVLAKYGIDPLQYSSNFEFLETPKEEKYFESVENILFVTNDAGLFAMSEEARELGYASEIRSNCIAGEAFELGEMLAKETYPAKTCVLYGGETTVTVAHAEGKGGRNQELVLGALPHLLENTVIVGAASDGWDNTEAAGAMGDKALFENAKQAGLHTEEYVHGRSYEFFLQLKDGHVVTGRTGANVADFYFVLSGGE